MGEICNTATKRWPSEICDYERGTITAVGIGSLDMHEGRWIVCEWCDSELKVSPPFAMTGWETHKKMKMHLNHKEKLQKDQSQTHNISFSQSSIPSSPSVLQEGMAACSPIVRTPDLEELALIRHELEIQKQQQVQHEREVKDVIDAMTSLIGDQQNDLGALQRQVHNMANALKTFKSEMEELQRKDRQLVKPSHENPYTAHSFASKQKTVRRKFSSKTRGDRNRGRSLQLNKEEGSYCDATDSSIIDMDIFEKRFQLVNRS